MVVRSWYTCPVCHRKLQKLQHDSILYNTPVYCRTCKIEWFPSIFDGRELGEDEPFPLKTESQA